MKPHEIAACVKKMFIEHPEKFRQGDYFEEGGYCALGAAMLCVNPEMDTEGCIERLPIEVLRFLDSFNTVNKKRLFIVNDEEGLPAILAGLEKMIEKGLADETH